MSALCWWFAVILPLITAHSLARVTLRGSSMAEQMLVTLAGVPAVILVIVLTLGVMGWLTPFNSVAVAAIIAAIALLVSLRQNSDIERASDQPRRTCPVCEPAVAVGVGLAAVVLGRQIRGGTSFSFDDLTYHASVVAHWVREGVLSISPFNYHAHYPFNAETLSLWFVLPLGSDAWAGLAGMIWLMVAALSVGTLSRRLGASTRASAAVAALTVATPSVVDQARTFSSVDLAASASTMAALSILLGSDRRVSLARCGWAGALSGYAAGCKPSFLLLPALFAVIAALSAGASRHRIARVSVVTMSAAVTGSFWYLRNYWLVGNPLFPAEIGPFGGPFGRVEQARTSLAWWMTSGRFEVGDWISLFRFHLGWPICLATLVLAGYFGALLMHREQLQVPRLGDLRIVLSVGLVSLLTYPFMPFTGSSNAPDPPFRMELRFLLLPFLIGLVLAAPLEKMSRWRSTWWACAVLSLVTSWRGDGFDAAVALAATATIAAMTEIAWMGRSTWKLGISLILGLGLLAVASPLVQRATDHQIFSHGSSKHPVGRGWKELESLAQDSRIAWFGPQMYQYYALFGRRYQLKPVSVDIYGNFGVALADRWLQGERPGWWAKSEDVELEPVEFCRNLRSSTIDYVFVSKWFGQDWPAQLNALHHCTGFEALWSDGYSTIFRVGH